jgi:hypothetical protein
MRGAHQIAATAATLLMLSAVSSADRLHENLLTGSAGEISAPDMSGIAPSAVATVRDGHELEGILGKEVRSSANENMGRVVNVLVDQTGETRAVIIDFGGFLGVGSRKIAVDWNTLHFPPTGDAQGRIVLELTQDQVKAAPEYKEGKTVVILGSLGAF